MFDLGRPEWVITFVFVAIMLATWLTFELRKRSRYAPLLPNLLTILGILGTFVGITFGLMSFDVGNVTESIPGLLAGLRAAFITSIFGIFFAFILRLRNHRHTLNQGQRAEDVTLADLVGSVDRMREESSASNMKLVRALSGDEEGTLLGQLKLLRSDQKDGNRAVGGKLDELRVQLVTEFRAFAETMAKQNTDALIDALSGVIRDFNEKLTEQFGENFKELNKAVGQLVQWQVHYRKMIDDSCRALQKVTTATEASAESIGTIKEDFSTVLSTSEELKKVLVSYAAHNESLDTNMQRFASAAENFEGRLPALKETVESLTSEFSRSVENSLEQVKLATSAHGKAAEGMVAQAEQFGNKVVEANQQTSAHIESTFDATNQMFAQLADETNAAVNNVITDTIGSFNANVQELVQNHLRQLETTNQNVSDTLNDNLLKLDSELGSALTRSLESLGQQLTALSQQFVADYMPLTERLKEIVRISEFKDA